MNPFDVIATDLDGTFLTDDHRVPQINAHAVRVAARRGIPTIYASGRPVRWFGVLDELAETHGWAVAANGAVTFDLATREVAHVRPMAADISLTAAEQIRERLPRAVFAAEYVSGWGSEPGFELHTREPGSPFQAPLDELLDRDEIVKLIVVDPATRTDELAAIARSIVGDRVTVTFSYVSAAGMLEMSAPGVSKALALRELLTDLGLPANRMIAFGDMPNDLQMLDLAGQGFVMDSSHPTVLGAGYPTAGDNNAGGVGATILRLLGEDA